MACPGRFGDGARLGHQLLVGGDQRLGRRQHGERDDQGRKDQERQQGHRQGDAPLVSQQLDVQVKATHEAPCRYGIFLSRTRDSMVARCLAGEPAPA
jgi:hypothetical protein